MIAVITDASTAWYFFTLEIAFKPGKQANMFFFALKESEQAEIVAFNILLVNYKYIFYFISAETRQLVLTVVTQVRKIWNGRTNDFSESYTCIFSFLCKDGERKQYIPHSSIHNCKC